MGERTAKNHDCWNAAYHAFVARVLCLLIRPPWGGVSHCFNSSSRMCCSHDHQSRSYFGPLEDEKPKREIDILTNAFVFQPEPAALDFLRECSYIPSRSAAVLTASQGQCS